MRVLVAIAYYGTANIAHVQRLISEYTSMSYDVDIVVMSEAPKDLDGVEVRVGLPTSNPYSLPFAHKPLFMDRRDDYDLFIYSEDDTLVTERAIERFLWATQVLPEQYIAGFLRTEQTADGELRCSSVNSRFHWKPDSAFEAGGEIFAEYTNPHGAVFMLTRDQLDRAIRSGGFDAPVRQGRLSMRVTAATDPYTQCGFTKAVCITKLDDFLLPHLTNRYSESEIGIPLDEFQGQADAVAATVSSDVSTARLFDPTTKLDDDARWDKMFWGPADHRIISSLPASASTVLSLGVGSGATEELLVQRGANIVGVPLDEIIAVSARRRGVVTTAPDLRSVRSAAPPDGFDSALALDVLHRFPDPTNILRELRTVLKPGGVIVASFPNLRREWVRWLARRTHTRPPVMGYEDAGVHMPGPHSIREWFRLAGWTGIEVTYAPVARIPGLLASAASATIQVRATVPTLPFARETYAGERPLVSVGMPVYNGEDYLEYALESIRAQDLADFEVILCDNASTDATESICRAAASSDPRIKYFRQERNLGAARNYNDCFVRSRGEFFTWLAHDDARASSFLSSCVEHFENSGRSVVLAYPRADFIDEAHLQSGPDRHGVETRAVSPRTRVSVAVSHTGAVNPVFGVIRASALEQTRLIGPFVASDRVLLTELAMLGELHEVPETLSFRRLHPAMSTNAHPSQEERTQWFDPEAKAPRLGELQTLWLEYSRSALRLPLSLTERALCLVTIPSRMARRRGRIALGRWRRQLAARVGTLGRRGGPGDR